MADEIKQHAERAAQYNIAALERKGSDYEFTDVHPFIKEALHYLQQVSGDDDFLSSLSESRHDDFRNKYQVFLELIDKVRDFDITQANPAQERDNLANQIRDQYNWLAEHLFPKYDLHWVKKELEAGKLTELTEQARSEVAKISEQQEQAEKTLTAIQQTAGQGGASKFTGVFSAQADHHKTMGRIWLLATLIVAGGIGYYVYWVISQLTKTITKGASVPVAVQLFFAKLLIVSLFSVVFYQVAKNYNAHRHQEVINRHRENSLLTFNAFVQATNNEKVQDAILLQASRTIFGASSTGYISDKHKTDTTPDVFQMIGQIKDKE